MHSKYLVKINEGAQSAKKPFSRRPQRGDCAQSGIKKKFPFADNCSLAWMLSSTHLPRLFLKTYTPTVQVHNVMNQILLPLMLQGENNLKHCSD